MIRLAIGTLAVLALTFGSCIGGKGAGTQAGGQSFATSHAGGGAPGSNPGSGLNLPEASPPHQFLLRVKREVKNRNVQGDYEVFQEVLRANGNGDFRLDVKGYAPSAGSPFLQPTQELLSLYEAHQRFMVLQRDPRFGPQDDVLRNYRILELPSTHQLAGRSCQVYRAESKHGLGSIELQVDQDTRVILGWSIRDEADTLLSELRTTEVFYDEPQPNVPWSKPGAPGKMSPNGVDVEAYLGFAPMPVRYIPQGFGLVRREILLLKPHFEDLFLEIYHDGMRSLFVAQQYDPKPTSPGGGMTLPGGSLPIARTHEARESLVGPLRVLEGNVNNVMVYVVGPLGHDDILTVFGSISY